VKLENVQKDVIMSISSASASNQINLAAFFAPAQGSPRHAEHGDRNSSGDGNSEGITVLASLLEALVQAATPSAASANAAAPASSATSAAGAAAAGTSTPAPTTGAATGTTGTATGTTGTTSTTTGTTSTTTGTTSTTNLVADLQAFLHDLFSALRQAGRSGHGGREHELWRERAETSNIPAPSTSTPASSTTTPASSTSAPASSATPVAPATTVTATSSPAAGSTTPVAVANPAVGAYGPRNIISELKALVQDLSNGQASSGTGSSGGVSQNLLSNLNSAFEKLISDLRGTASAAGTTPTASTPAASTPATGSATSGTAAAGASTTAPSPTSALQAFLTNFAQDLQNNGAHSLNPVGTSVNTTA
jgi:hypothetical protein